VVEHGRAIGVVAAGRHEVARAVVSNADVRRTFLELVGREHLPRDFARRVEALRPSTSAFVVFLGLDTTLDAAPLTMVGSDGQWQRKQPGYARAKRELGDALIGRAEEIFPGLSRHIVYRQEGSPATFARYAWTTGGAIYGPATGPWQPPTRSPITGLVLAGAGVFPGAGVEAVVISGTLAADALCAGVKAPTEAAEPCLTAA
jgi:phytoene dehydrogenase-like protein